MGFDMSLLQPRVAIFRGLFFLVIFNFKKTETMSKSKIAIVIAPGINTPDRCAAIGKIIQGVSDAGGIGLIIPSQNAVDDIGEILQLVDGVLLICPESPEAFGTRTIIEGEDDYVRAFGRLAIESGINVVTIIGDRSFFGTEAEWQDWAYFLRTTAPALSISGIEKIHQRLADSVPSAQARSAFARLARSSSRRLDPGMKSPVTHG
jgi:hypothetical protein